MSEEIEVRMIRYVALSIGLISSTVTIGLILINRMWTKVYPLLLLIVSISSLAISIISLTGALQPDIDQTIGCVNAILFYFFWMVFNLYSAFILFVIYLELKGRKREIKRLLMRVSLLIFVIAVAFSTAPYKQYGYCPSKQVKAFYGICPSQQNFWESLIWFNLMFPILVGMVVLVILYKARMHLTPSLGQSNVLKILRIPNFWMALLIINALNQFAGYIFYPPPDLSFLHYLSIILDQTMFFNPLINLIFFVMMIRNLNDVVDVQVKYCLWLLGGKQSQQALVSSLYE